MFNFLFVCVFFIREWQVGRTVRCSSAWADREGCVQGEGGQKALPLLFTHHTHLRLHPRLLRSCSFSWSIRYHGVAGTRQSNISSFLFDFWPHLSSRIHWGRGASGRLMSRSSCIDQRTTPARPGSWGGLSFQLLRRLKQDGCKCKASPGYRESSWLAWITQEDPNSKFKKKTFLKDQESGSEVDPLPSMCEAWVQFPVPS